MIVSFRCDSCGQLYRVPEEKVGQGAICRHCGQPLNPPLTPPKSQSTLLPILSPPAPRSLEGPLLSPELVVQHVESNLGSIQGRFHDPRSPIEILHLASSSPQSTQRLFTTGVSRFPMPVPDRIAASDRVELMLELPREWTLDDSTTGNPSAFWPIQLLQSLGRLPGERKNWIAAGQLIPNGDPPQPYGESIPFVACLLLPPLNTPKDFARWFPQPGVSVEFLAVIPLLRDEVEFSLKRGLSQLLKRLDSAGVSELLTPSRKSSCRKSFWRFW